MENLNIFEMLYDDYKINKPLRVIELFAGYGSQSLALKYLGVNYEHWKICEWAIHSLIAYASVHRNELENYGKDFTEGMTKEDIIEKLLELGISKDNNVPATKDNLKSVKEDRLRLCYNSIIWSHNLVDVSRVNGKDLEIVDTDKYDYLLTYSFPCITKDSLILTKRGYIEMKDVTTDDIVLTKSNTWQKVAQKFDNGIHQTCYLDGMGFENIHCTLNHKFYVREKYREWDNKKRVYVRKFKDPDFKEAKDLTKSDYFGVPVIQEEKQFYTDDLDFWYMIGMYLGDGWLSKNNNDIIIACNDQKLELLKSRLDKKKYNWTYSWNGTCYRFRFSNKEIYNFIKDNIGTGCEIKHIPYEILCLPKKQLLEIHNGYLDSDGCKIGDKRQFSSINRNLIYSMSLIINKLFNKPTRVYKVKVKPQKQIEDRIVNQKDYYMLVYKIYDKKQDKAFYDNGYIWYPFNKLVMAEKEHVYNMEIENDHSYIVQGCISKNCQNLSVAGRMEKLKTIDEINDDNLYDIENRSNMLWQVDRILSECEHKPTILLLENVIGVHGAGNEVPFRQWISRLENYGYQSYWSDLSATDFKIPQSRNRCFMVSILGNSWNYKFPKKQKLDLRLRDMLQDEDDVDEKYILSEALLNCFMSEGTGKYPRRERFLQNMNRENQDIANSITTLAGNRPTDNFVIRGLKNKALKETLEKNNIEDVEDVGYIDAYNREIKTDGNSGTITTRVDAANNSFVIVKNGKIRIPLKRGYSCEVSPEQEDTDKIDFIGNYSKSNFNQTSIVGKNGIAPTVTENHGQVTSICECELLGGFGEKDSNGGTQWKFQNRVYNSENSSPSVTTAFNPNYKTGLRIRKLTPKECFRLQAVKDEDIDLIMKNQSNSLGYHLAGDSICITVLMAIFSKLFDINWLDHFNPEEWWKN